MTLRPLPRPRLPASLKALLAAAAAAETPDQDAARRDLAERLARWSRKTARADGLEA